MTTIATKLQTGTAACAIAVAATLVPVAAQAAPSVSVPTAPVTQALHELNLGPAALPEFNWWWFGTPNPAPPPRLTLLSFKVPILTPVLGALGLLNKEFCIVGLGVKIGPYGRITVSL